MSPGPRIPPELRERIDAAVRRSPRSAGGTVPAPEPLAGGAPLDAATRRRMEAAFGRSFSSVRVHDDSRGSALAGRYGAAAVTLGSDVAFAAGRYRPGTPVGEALIAHELAHVAQQRGGDGGGVAGPAPVEAAATAGRRGSTGRPLAAAADPPTGTRLTTAAEERDADRSAGRAMEGLYARALGMGSEPAAGWARPRRSLGAAVAPAICEKAPQQCEEPCEGPATCTIDSAVRPLAGRGALRLDVEGHTCIQAGHAELYNYQGEDPDNCNFGDALQPPIMVAPVALGCFDIETPTTLTMVPGVGHNVLVRVVDATDPSNTAIACATVTAT